MIISGGKALDFAPQALGETTPFLANGYFYATQGMGLINQYASYSALYRAQPSIATVIDKVANAAARLTVKVWDVTPATGRVQDTDSDYAKLMANPCTELSPFAFWRWTFSTYEVYGEAFWYKQRAGMDAFGRPSGKVVNLLPMHPSRTAVHRNTEGDVEYIFTLGVASTGILHAPAEDVVAFLRYNPDNLMRGLSRLESLRTTLKNEDAARRANESFWRKGARPSVVLTHPGELSQEAIDRIKQSFDARHSGADNAGSTAVLQEGMTPFIAQLNAEEMQYIESRKMNLQEVCMVYDVPPPVVHILDHATFSNITEQMRSMYRDTMSPRLEDVESVIDYSLLPEFFSPGQRETEFDMAEVLRGDFETRADKAVTLRQSGIFTGNQALELVGLPRSENPAMDVVMANAALAPLAVPVDAPDMSGQRSPDEIAKLVDSVGALIRAGFDPESALASIGLDPIAHLGLLPVTLQTADAGTVADPTDMLPPASAAPAAKALTVRAIMGKLARVKDNKAAIRKTLVAEHAKSLHSFFAEQRASVKSKIGSKAAGLFVPSAWDADLTDILHTLSKATAQAIGTKVAADLGGEYKSDDIAEWLTSNSADTAKKINQKTAEEIIRALENAAEGVAEADTIDAVFDGEVDARADQISLTRVALVGGLAALVAARLSGAGTKTWVVTSANPRPSHASMAGETVPLNQPFSNGMNGPGDYAGGADEVAGCTCDLEFTKESSVDPLLNAQDYYAEQAKG